MQILTATSLVLLNLATQAFTAAVVAPEGDGQLARRDPDTNLWGVSQVCQSNYPVQRC